MSIPCDRQHAKGETPSGSPQRKLTCTPHLLYFTLCLFVLNSIVWAQSPLQIIHADAGSLVFTFKLPDLQVSKREIRGTSFSEVSFENAMLTMEIGQPRLPVYVQLIGIPVNTSPRASIINARTEIHSTGTIILVQPDMVLPSDSESAQERSSPIIDADFYRKDRFHPIHPVEIVPLGFVREQRVARLQIQPVQYNPVRSQLKIYRELQIRIDFNQPTYLTELRSGQPVAPSRFILGNQPSQAFEQVFKTSLLNYAQAKAWRQPPRPQPPMFSAPVAQTATEEKYRILINRTDIYEITFGNLQRAGADPSQIDLNTVKMENGGRQIGIYIFDQNADGKFDRDDSIVFYARQLNHNRFTNDNVYWLYWGGLGSSRVNEIDAVPKTPNALVPFAFKETAYFEDDRWHNPLSGTDIKSELADHYFWIALTAQSADSRERSVRIELPGAIPPTRINRLAELRIRFQGIFNKGTARHKARIRFNGKQLGQIVEWRKQEAPQIVRSIEQRRLFSPNQTNFLTIKAEDEKGAPPGEVDFYIDWFELDYWHAFTAVGGSLEFSSDTEPRSVGAVRYRVTNLRRPDIDVYAIRDGQIVGKKVNGLINQVAGATYQISFEDSVTQPTSYFVVERNAYRRVSRISKVVPSTLRNPGNQADYVIISHSTFIDSIQPLAEFRQSQGLSVMVVDVEEVYDQFSHGIFNPIAIQKFMRYAFTNWQKPAPTYVLLVGDAHYDYKDSILGYYRREFSSSYDLYPIFVPTFHGWANNSGEAAMDHRFVTISGDDPLPDMFIGRLSVQSPQELNGMVRKIINYEQHPTIGPWQHVLMQVADNDVDNPGDAIFERGRETLINEIIPIAYETRKVYLRQIMNSERTKSLILQGIDEGVVILEYSGHGGTETWADEGIFRIENAQSLRNQHLPFIVTTTCLNGQFDKPLEFGQRSLSEQFMIGRYGAIGTLSATRLTLATSNAEFDKELFKSIFTIKPPTLGAIIADAKINFLTRGRSLWISDVEQYTLFGDPATRLALPDLEIKVDLQETVLNANKNITILPNVVGQDGISPITGVLEFRKVTDFSTNTMSALVLFPNDLDNNPTNDLPKRQENLQVWQGDYGEIRIGIPAGAESGAGIVRLFAYDNERAAVGGAQFWLDQPVIREVRPEMDANVTNTLSFSVQIVDDAGPAGIKSVELIWSDTVKFENHTTFMIPHPSPPNAAVTGGQWYTMPDPIPLPKGGKSVNYQIIVTDNTGRVVFFPSEKGRERIRVPEGANITIATKAIGAEPIRYGFSNELKTNTLTVELVNDGGRDVPIDFEVWFSEGNPDVNNDRQIDASADVFGSVRVQPSDWVPGDDVLQKVTVVLPLKTPLSTGAHKVFVFADPESPDNDPDDGIIGRLDEPREHDNKASRTFIVNQFTLKPDEELTAFSLDRVFDAFFQTGAAEPTSLSVDSTEPPLSFQPDLNFAAIPPVASGQGPEATQAYVIDLHSGAKALKKPIEVKLRFDISGLTNHVAEKYRLRIGEDGFDEALRREADAMAIYAWQDEIKAWKRLPSEILRDVQEGFLRDKYVTPVRAENTSAQQLRISDVRVDVNFTPGGKWTIFFIDSERYEVLLLRKGQNKIEKLSQSGQLDEIFRDEILGIELTIPRDEAQMPFEFGDVLKFETVLGSSGDMTLSTVNNSNTGNGSANVSTDAGESDKFDTGDWLIFFEDSTKFQLWNNLNEPVRNERGTLVRGTVGSLLKVSNLGIEILISSGKEPFEFGDKFKFSTATVGVISAKVKELSPFALMISEDRESPRLQLWVNGEVPEPGSVIPPRPDISLSLEDANGIDMDSFKFAVSKNDGPFENITEFDVTPPEQVTTIAVRYKPILFKAQYLFRIWVQDLNGNWASGEGGFREFLFRVEEQPDLEPPHIEIMANGEPLFDGAILREQPRFEIQITDTHSIHPETVQLAFAREGELLMPLELNQYNFEFDAAQATQAKIIFAPNLSNDDYQLQVLASDTSENTSDDQVYRLQLDEPVAIIDVLNAPNPMRTSTFFTYNLAQVPDSVTIKIYTVTGRLIRTLADASARRNYNETYWDGRDEHGVRLANGIYLYQILVSTADQKLKKTGKLAILR